MNPTREKFILGALSIALFFVSSALMLGASLFISRHSAFSLNFMRNLIFGYNLVVLFAWMVFGTLGGISAAVVVSVFAFLFNLKNGIGSHILLLAPFAVSSAVGYAYSEMTGQLERTQNLKSEKLDEDINLASRDVNKKREEIDSLKKKFERYAMLKEVAEGLSATLSLGDIASFIVDSSSRVIDKAQRFLLYLVDREKQELSVCATRVISGDEGRVELKRGDAFDSWVMHQRKALIIEDIVSDFRFSHDNQESGRRYFRSLISAPLMSEDKITGILRLDSPMELSYAQDDLRLLDIISDLAAVAVENCFLYKRTEELARKDGLTNLAVRRYFMERLLQEVQRSAITKSTFSLLMLDIDHFKEYNDKFGHISGDLVLRYLAGLLASSAREGDIVARYGGEEFALVLLRMGKAAAADKAEAIRRRVEEEPLTLRRQKARLTVSIGVAAYPEDARVAEELIKKSDENLYKAKRRGRNRVCS